MEFTGVTDFTLLTDMTLAFGAGVVIGSVFHFILKILKQ